MTTRWTMWAGVALLAGTTACLATKNDVRLLQDGQVAAARADSARMARADAMRAAQGDSVKRILRDNQEQMAQLFAQEMAQSQRETDALVDSVTAISARLVNFQALTIEGQRDLLNLISQVKELSQGNQGRLVQQLREQLESSAGGSSSAVRDSAHAQSAASDVEPPATLFKHAMDLYGQGSCSTARDMLGVFLQSYGKDALAAQAQLGVANTYECEGNTPAADSVYQVVVGRFPKTDQAATALYKHGEALCSAGKKDSALAIFKKIVSDYPALSMVYPQAKERTKDPCS